MVGPTIIAAFVLAASFLIIATAYIAYKGD